MYVPLTESRPFAEKETGILILILSPFRANQPKGTAIFIFDLLGSLISIALIVLVVAALTGNLFFVVKQQHAVIIERLGKFNRIVGAGFHVKIPFIDRKAATVSPRTMKNGSTST